MDSFDIEAARREAAWVMDHNKDDFSDAERRNAHLILAACNEIEILRAMDMTATSAQWEGAYKAARAEIVRLRKERMEWAAAVKKQDDEIEQLNKDWMAEANRAERFVRDIDDLKTEIERLRNLHHIALEATRDANYLTEKADAEIERLREALRHIPQCGNCASGRYYYCETYRAALEIKASD